MRILLLGSDNSECEELRRYLFSCGEEVIFIAEKITSEKVREINPDIIISYNYRHILKEDVFLMPILGTINLHISYLPWNRGADPNFWSHLEGTPKGVTIHYINAGIDTGDIIGQELVEFSEKDTLKSSYEKLHIAIRELFKKLWPKIKSGQAPRRKQRGKGTFHLVKDKEPFLNLFSERGYDTPIEDLNKFRKTA